MMTYLDRVRRGLAQTRLSLGGVPGTNLARGTAYAFTPVARGGRGNKTFSVTGSLPPGLSFNAGTGAITGTPT